MSKLKIKSPGQKLQIKAKLGFGEHWNRKEEDLLMTLNLQGLMRADSLSGRSAVFSAAADSTLASYLHRKIDAEAFYRIIIQIVNVQRRVEHENLMNANLQLDPQWIFINCHTQELFFLYLPLEQPGEIPNLHGLLGQVANAAAEQVEPAALDELRGLLSASGAIRNRDLERLVVKYRPKLYSEFAYPATKPSRTARHKGTVVLEEDQPVNDGTVLLEDDSDGTELIPDDDAEDAYDGTISLEELARRRKPKPRPRPMLRRVKTGEEIAVTKDVFRLGKRAGGADYCVEDNPAVSRRHADLIRRDGVCYVYDNNSMNGTWVDDQQIPKMQEFELTDGCTLRLADENFEYFIKME